MIIPIRDENGNAIPHIFEKIVTGVEEQRFATGDSGKTYICTLADSSDPAYELEDPDDPSSLLKRDFALPFEYANGLGQLDVSLSYNSGYFLNICNADEVPQPLWATFASTRFMWREIAPNTVRLLNMNILTDGGASESNICIRFRTMYTSRPGSLTEKPVITTQGDGIGMELVGSGNGIVLKSADGSRYIMTVTDDGQLDISEI